MVLNIAEFCKEVGIRRATLYRLLRAAHEPAIVRVRTRRVAITKKSAATWLKSREVPTTGKAA